LCNAVLGIRSIKTINEREFLSTEAASELYSGIHDWDDVGPRG
jgi:hypothetical protein